MSSKPFYGVASSQVGNGFASGVQGVVTPEAVVLQFDTAGLGSRIVAAGIDALPRVLALLLIALAAFVFNLIGGRFEDWVGKPILIISGFLVLLGYSAIFETVWRGRTPGKAALGLRVVTVEGAPISFRHAAIRAAVGIFEIFATFGVVACFASFVSSRGQRLGDMAGGTLVLRERSAQGTPQVSYFTPPPGTESYASTLDVSKLNSEEYLTIRSFLLRAPSLDYRSRIAVADQLGRQFLTRLSTEPPNWMPSEVFLVCVAAAYQRRFQPVT